MKKQYKQFLEDCNLPIFDLKYFSNRDRLKKILEKHFNKVKKESQKTLHVMAVNRQYVNFGSKLKKLLSKAFLKGRVYNITLLLCEYGFENKEVSMIVNNYIKKSNEPPFKIR